eukprot:gnl/Dysnectes_brevis/4403_a5896_1015.p1 GENE.gnl/Dysnectes_brevis/4403_a5896_1015~~gnl/Dysnectes_brevis/4403_a5896_1015.p1  ORF type:complete len:147 (+),score=22.24 gnl/Dysnectes_brevis/4403_a5896_1015:121-561(+)
MSHHSCDTPIAPRQAILTTDQLSTPGSSSSVSPRRSAPRSALKSASRSALHMSVSGSPPKSVSFNATPESIPKYSYTPEKEEQHEQPTPVRIVEESVRCLADEEEYTPERFHALQEEIKEVLDVVSQLRLENKMLKEELIELRGLE